MIDIQSNQPRKPREPGQNARGIEGSTRSIDPRRQQTDVMIGND